MIRLLSGDCRDVLPTLPAEDPEDERMADLFIDMAAD